MISLSIVFTTNVEATWWNTDWSYYKECNISNPNNNYQMKLIVGHDSGDSCDVHCENHCQDDFGDIRFVDIDNSTSLHYWMESYTSGVNATFYINTSADVATDNKILMYYGTSGTNTTTSNGENTFIYFLDQGVGAGSWDEYTDRNGGTLVRVDTPQKRTSSKAYSIQQDSGSVPGWFRDTIPEQTGLFIFEADCRQQLSNQRIYGPLLSTTALTFTTGDYGPYPKWSSTASYDYYDTAWKQIFSYSADTWYKVGLYVSLTDDDVDIYIDDVLKISSGGFAYSNTQTALNQVVIGGHDDYTSGELFIQDCRIREWVSGIQPSFSSFGAEQTQGASATVPVVTTNAVTGVEETNATIRGTLTNNGSADTTCWFRYGDETPPTDNNVSQGVKAHEATFNYNWQSLTPGKLYYFDTQANNSEGWDTTGGIKSFLTKPNTPTGASCSAGDGWTNVSWTAATGADKYLVRYKSASSPTSITDGTLFDNVTVLYINKSIGAGTHYFSIWSYAYESSPALSHYSDSYDTTSGTELVVPTWHSSSFGGSVIVTSSNTAPVINTSTISPVNESTSVSTSPTLSVYVSDVDDATQDMNITWYEGNYTSLTETTSWTDKGGNQGVAVDDTYFYTTYGHSSGDDNCIVRKYWKSNGTQALSNTWSKANDLEDFYFNDGNIIDGFLYVTSINFPDTSPKESRVWKINPATLTITNNWSIGGAHWVEGIDYYDGYFWVVYGDINSTTFSDRNISKYNSTFVLQENYTLSYSMGAGDDGQGYQGICWRGSDIFLALHNSHPDCPRVDRYHWNGTGFEEVKQYNTSGVDVANDIDQGCAYDSSTDRFWFIHRNAGGTTNTPYDVTICSLTGWHEVQQNNSVNNGTYYYDFTNASANSFTYYWKVNVTDGHSGYDDGIFHFTTIVPDIDVEINDSSWIAGSLDCGDDVQKNFTFYQNGSATIDITIGINSTNGNYSFVNYTTWSGNGHDQYCANFTVDTWSSESMIEPDYPASSVLKSSFAPGNFVYGIRLWMPKSVTYQDRQENFEVVLYVSEST